MTITDEVLRMLARASVSRLAPDPQQRPHLEAHLVSHFRSVLADAFGGERIALYAGRRHARAEQRQRILAALAAGEATAEIARREGCSVTWVRALRRSGTIRP